MKIVLSTCGVCPRFAAPSFLRKIKPKDIHMSSRINMKHLGLIPLNGPCNPGEKGCETTPSPSTKATKMNPTTKTSPLLARTELLPPTCPPEQPDCENYRECFIDKISGKYHCKVMYFTKNSYWYM